jgi:hypothetical protein
MPDQPRGRQAQALARAGQAALASGRRSTAHDDKTGYQAHRQCVSILPPRRDAVFNRFTYPITGVVMQASIRSTLLVLAAGLLTSTAAWAHAHLKAAEPAANSVVSSPASLSLSFPKRWK